MPNLSNSEIGNESDYGWKDGYTDNIPVNVWARIFLLVDLQELFFRLRLRVGGTKKINKKALKMTS